MTTGPKQLSISLNRQEKTDLAKLGQHCTVTAKMLAAQAVRQVLATARGDATPAVPLLDPAGGPKAGAGVTITLQKAEAAALDALAARLNVTPEGLGRAAVLGLLEAAMAGAVPMMKPVTIAEPLDPFAGSADRRANCNFEKARMTVDKLAVLADLGADPAKPRAHIDFMAALDELQNFSPD